MARVQVLEQMLGQMLGHGCSANHGEQAVRHWLGFPPSTVLGHVSAHEFFQRVKVQHDEGEQGAPEQVISDGAVKRH